jgi:hypothetical protein
VSVGAGTTITRHAPVVARREIFIEAPVDCVWPILADVSRWCEWLPDMTSTGLDGPLRPGAVAHWHDVNHTVSTIVTEVVPFRRMAWAGPMVGILAVQVWTITESGTGLIVRAEESWEGLGLASDAARLQRGLELSLTSWLRRLKLRSEGVIQAPALGLTVES